jgi:hypothetical protein
MKQQNNNSKFFFTGFIILISLNSLAQACWTYQLNFTLSDRFGNKIDESNFESKGVQLFVETYQGFSKYDLKKNSSSGEFELKQHTIYTKVKFVLLSYSDTMYIEASTHTTHLGNIKLKNGYYEIPHWVSSKDYNCSKLEINCFLKKPLNSYKQSAKKNWKFTKSD